MTKPERVTKSSSRPSDRCATTQGITPAVEGVAGAVGGVDSSSSVRRALTFFAAPSAPQQVSRARPSGGIANGVSCATDHSDGEPMTLTCNARRTARATLTIAAAGCALAISIDAKAALTLNAAGIADGFSLSTFYSDAVVQYGLLGAVATPGGTAIGSGFARGQLYKFSD